MPPSPLPNHLVAFLAAHIDHRVKLDLLLFLQRVGTTPVWIAATELSVSKDQIRDMGRELARAGILRVEGDRLEVAPRTVEDRLAILDLVTWYTLDRTRIFQILRTLGRGA